MSIKLIDVIKRHVYEWPDGREVYNAVVYEVRFHGLKHRVLIGFTKREAFQKNRRRVVVFVDDYPEAEFAGADNYADSGLVVAMIRNPDGKYMKTDDIHSEYYGMPVADHSQYISKDFGGREGTAALIVAEDDHRTMIRHALIQSRWRKARGG
jgi:hypothetical protein